jgi:hypothetical protein
MTEPTVPMHIFFTQLVEHPAFRKLRERAEDIIKTEQDKFWKIEDRDEAEVQRMKASYYKDLWETLVVYIKNSQNHPNK